MSTSLTLDRGGSLRKVLPIIVAAALLVAASTALYLSAVHSASAAKPSDFGLTEGNTISSPGSDDPDIYIINDAGFKRLFLNPAIFNMYGHLGGFANVKSVSPTVRDAFVTSGLYRNCETNDQKVYGVEVTGEDVGVFHWVNTTGAQAVMDDPNFFQKVFCINTTEFNWYPKGANYTSVNQVPDYSRTHGTGTPAQSGPVSVSLASDNPASSTFVSGTTTAEARADLAHFMFTGNATVTSLELKRMGVSADATLANVYLYDGNKRLTDSATVSDGKITFNDAGGLFSAMGGKVISVKAEIATSAAGQTVGVQVTKANGNVVGPISGNLHTFATADLATVTLSATTTPSSDSTPIPANDFIAWQNTATIGTRYVWLKSIQFRVVGSVQPGDVQNFRLYADGIQVGSAVAQQDANGYVVFDVSGSPVKLETGGRVLKVMADIVNGSGKTFYLSIRQKPDLWTVDSQYNAAVNVSSTTFPVSSTAQTIDNGTLSFTKTNDSASGDVVRDASNVSLAKWEVKATGERMKIESLKATVTATDSNVDGLRNSAFFLDGVQIGSTKLLAEDGGGSGAASTEYTFGSSFIVEPGHPRMLELRADIYDSFNSASVTADTTVTGKIIAASSNVQRLTTLDYISCLNGTDCSSTSAGAGNALTVKTGSFTAGKFTGFANQSVVASTNGAKLGHFTLIAASSEPINVNSVNLTASTTGSSFTASGSITDAFIKVWNDSGTLIYTSPIKSSIAAIRNTTSVSYSVNFQIPVNKTYQIEIYGNIGTGIGTSDVVTFKMDANGVTANSSTSAHASKATGQTLTAASGSLNVQAAAVPAASFRAGGTTVTAYSFTMQPQYDSFFIDEVYVDLANTGATDLGAVSGLTLKAAGVSIGTGVLNSSTGSASFTGLNYSLPQNGGSKTFTVEVTTANVGVGANATGGDVKVRLDGYKSRPASTGVSTTTTGLAPSTNTGNSNVVAKAYPAFSNQALPSTVLAPGAMTLFKTQVATTGGDIAYRNISFVVASSSSGFSLGSYKLYENGIDTGISASSSHDATNHVDRIEFNSSSTDRVISTGTTLELRATVTGSVSTGNSVTTQIANPQGTTVTATTSTAQIAKDASFVWSDMSAASHGTGSSDWLTDGLLKAIAEPQTISK